MSTWLASYRQNNKGIEMIAEYLLGAAIRIVGSCVFIVCLLMSINYQSLVLAVLACAGALLTAGTSISMAILSMKNEVKKEP